MPIRFDGNIYNNFLDNNLSELLEDGLLNVRQRFAFQQDDVPPHNARCMR